MRANKEAELLIDLAHIQIQHDAAVSRYTVLLSVLVSLMLAIVSVYIPLTLFLNNIYYSVFAIGFIVALLGPLLWIEGKMKKTEEKMETQIQDLRNSYSDTNRNGRRNQQ